MAKDRKEKILGFINTNKFLTYDDLSDLLNVSVNTIRRDIDELDREDKVIKVKGGSIIRNDYKQYKSNIDYQRKRAIGKIAASFIKDGETVILDGGTTIKQIVPFLADKKNLTIFTQSLDIASEISMLENPGITLMGAGGILDYKVNIYFSEQSSLAMSKYNFDRGFLSTSAISIEDGITNYNLPSYHNKHIIINASKDYYFLIDSNKFGKSSLQKVCDLDKVKNIITDKDLDKGLADEFKKIIPNFYIADY